jgi:hypothetical protein
LLEGISFPPIAAYTEDIPRLALMLVPEILYVHRWDTFFHPMPYPIVSEYSSLVCNRNFGHVAFPRNKRKLRK